MSTSNRTQSNRQQMMTRRGAMALALAVGLALASATNLAAAEGKSDDAPGKWIRNPNAADLQGREVATVWMDLLYDLVKAERLSPTVASRAYGIAVVALYESVVAGIPDHRSLGGQLNGLGELPAVEKSKKIHWATAANAALGSTLRGLFPSGSAATLDAIDSTERRLSAAHRAPPPVAARSVEYGRGVAEAVLAWAAGDGYAQLHNCPYTPPVGVGLWVPTPPAFAPPLEPCWGQLRTFALVAGTECAPPPPPTYSEDPSSEMYLVAKEVYETRLNLTTEQETIARYWADGPVATGTPPGHWIAIVGQLARADGLTLGQTAEAYARVGIAVADAFIVCWNAKYRDNLLRPITYIQKVFDPAWTPLLTTPNFPEHTSGHSTQSGAAAVQLTSFFGTRAFTDTLHTDHHLVPALAPRSFDSFEEAAQEAMNSRLYGGIHYRTGDQLGYDSGVCVGTTINSRIAFLK